MHSILQLTVIGTVFTPNAGKTLALNRDLDQYVACVKWHLSFRSTSKTHLHKQAYQQAKNKFTLKTALLQSARDKVVEIYTSFQQVKAKNSKSRLKQCFIRFDERIEYKALQHRIRVKYIDPKDTTKECHRCGTINEVETARQYRCANPKCSLKYDRDLNASINIAQRITISLGWGTRGCPEQPHEVSVARPSRMVEATPFRECVIHPL